MKLIRKKIVLIGAFGVGKTSLVRRFVSNEFSESYISTIGVRVEKRVLELDDVNMELMVWDVAGEDEFSRLQAGYLRGASGVLLIADATRSWTLIKAQELKNEHEKLTGSAPWHCIINKSDLDTDGQLEAALAGTDFTDAPRLSAKTGDGVEQAFELMARQIMQVGS